MNHFISMHLMDNWFQVETFSTLWTCGCKGHLSYANAWDGYHVLLYHTFCFNPVEWIIQHIQYINPAYINTLREFHLSAAITIQNHRREIQPYPNNQDTQQLMAVQKLTTSGVNCAGTKLSSMAMAIGQRAPLSWWLARVICWPCYPTIKCGNIDLSQVDMYLDIFCTRASNIVKTVSMQYL